jgi:hypothetical protein
MVLPLLWFSMRPKHRGLSVRKLDAAGFAVIVMTMVEAE